MARITSPNKIELSDDEQEHLFALIHKGVNSARVITCARILTKLAKGHFNQNICLPWMSRYIRFKNPKASR